MTERERVDVSKQKDNEKLIQDLREVGWRAALHSSRENSGLVEGAAHVRKTAQEAENLRNSE
ncbi:MAG: hypothetical protein ACREHC_01280 [Candidatus Levyibacteriota bacterium]